MDNYNEKQIKTYVKIWVIAGISVMTLIAAVVITFVALSNYFTRGEPERNIYNITYGGDSDTEGGVWIADMMGANAIEVYSTGSAGSGFIITVDGGRPIALTNYHVIESGVSSGNIGARTVYDTGAYAPGCELLGYDTYHDVAVIKLPARYKDYTFLDLMSPTSEGFEKDSWFADPVLGEKMYAIGNALGEGLGMTDGICSKQSTVISIESSKMSAKNVPVFQTTAAINSGMSGGPVFNKYGQIAGIGTYKAAGTVSSGNTVDIPDDMNYAVPVKLALEIYKRIGNNGADKQVSLTKSGDYTIGLTATDSGYQFNAFGLTAAGKSGVTLHGALGFSGVMRSGLGVNNKGLLVTARSLSGLSAGDVITKINGRAVDDYGKLFSAIYGLDVISVNTSEPALITLSSGAEIEWTGTASGTHYRVVAK